LLHWGLRLGVAVELDAMDANSNPTPLMPLILSMEKQLDTLTRPVIAKSTTANKGAALKSRK